MGQNSALIRQWFDEVWNQGREETVDAMCAQDVMGRGQARHGADIHGPEHCKQFLRTFLRGFSDIQAENPRHDRTRRQSHGALDSNPDACSNVSGDTFLGQARQC